MWNLPGGKEHGDSFPGDPARPSLALSPVDAGSSSARCPQSPQAQLNQDSAAAKRCRRSSAPCSPLSLLTLLGDFSRPEQTLALCSGAGILSGCAFQVIPRLLWCISWRWGLTRLLFLLIST